MKQIAIWILAALLLNACSSDDGPEVSLSTDKLTFETGQLSQNISVYANTHKWSAETDQSWCTVTKTGDGTLQVTVTNYAGENDRTASLTLLVDGAKHTSIEVIQKGIGTYGEITIPVVYTLLYSGQKPNIPYNLIQTNFDVLRRFFRNQYIAEGSVDIKVNFVLAQTDPQGNRMDTPGFRYFETEQPVVSYNTLVTRSITDFADGIQWDTETYINIYLFDDNSMGLQGVSTLPYTPSWNRLPGLTDGDYYFNKNNPVDEFRFVVIDLPHLIDEPAAATIAHEMGHYLGLFHCFSYGCSDDDYCDDTPNYNRTSYERGSGGYERTACDGTSFISRNVMDYYDSYFDRFSPQQNARMQHVLNYSPLIPGRKLGRTSAQYMFSTSAAIKPKMQVIE